MAGGGRIIPREPKARFATLRLQALCDGILDASVLLVYEDRYRPADKHVQVWVDRQADKIARGLAALEAAPPALDPVPDVGQIALACVLGYRDLRFDGTWREGHPRLVAWHDKFAGQVPPSRRPRSRPPSRDAHKQKPRSAPGLCILWAAVPVRTYSSVRRERCWSGIWMLSDPSTELPWPRSTYIYSSLADQGPLICASMPPPAVQPALVSSRIAEAGDRRLDVADRGHRRSRKA